MLWSDNINALRIFLEQCAKFRSALHLLFEYFDIVNREDIWNALCNINIPEKLTAIVRVSYDRAKCDVLHREVLESKAECARVEFCHRYYFSPLSVMTTTSNSQLTFSMVHRGTS